MSHVTAEAPSILDETKRSTTRMWAQGPGTQARATMTAGILRSVVSVRSGSIIRMIGLAMFVCTLGVAGVSVQYMRQQTEDAYRREIDSLGTVLAEQTYRYIQEIDLALRSIREKIDEQQLGSADQLERFMRGRDMHAVLESHLQNMAQVDALNVFDANGQLVNSSRQFPPASINVADREYFRHFAELKQTGIYVSGTLVSKVTGEQSVYIARRIIGARGEFLGVVSGVIDVGYLRSFYNAANNRPGQTLTLLRRDGLVLVREPDPRRDTGTNMPGDSPWYSRVQQGGGWYASPGYLGGVPALVSVHPVRDYPLAFDVSVQVPVALAAWRHQAALLGIAGVVAGAGFAILFWYVGRLFHRQAAQNRALQRIGADLQTTLDNMDQGLMVIAKDRSVPICNRRAVELLDLPSEMMVACPQWEDVLAYQWQANEFVDADRELQQLVHGTTLLDGPLVYDRVRPNGRVLEVRTSPLPGGEAVRTYTDITERKRAEQRVEFLAHHDGLTGLANRVLLEDRLTQCIAYARRGGKQIAVLALDLDHFKGVNDALGHAAGDSVLIEAARRLRAVVRAGDTVARIGGDEFVIVQTEAPQPGGAVEVAERIIEAMSKPFEVAGSLLQIGTSIGIAIHAADAQTAAPLLQFADIALYRAKADGGGAYRLFEPGMDLRLRERREIEQDLRLAIGSDQLRLVYQPQITCATGELTGFEALMRWHHPTRGEVPPSVFIPIAEETKLIRELGAWALEEACKAACQWSEPLQVAVNLSAVQFPGGRLVRQIADVLQRTGLPASRLELEVTETLLMDDPDEAHSTLSALKAMGVHVALDDFGTGYSSLGYLLRYPFDRVKIDRSFVQAMVGDAGARSIVHAILALARSLSVDVTAEGIETEQQLDILQQEMCPQVQGYLLGRPMPSDDVGQFIAAHGDDQKGDEQ